MFRNKRQLSLLLGLIGTLCWASSPLQPIDVDMKDIQLEADNVAYLNDGKTVVASGNVKVGYQNYRVNADEFTYNPVTRDLLFSGNAILRQETSAMTADRLKVNFQTLTGVATHMMYESDKITIRGEHLAFSPDRIDIKDVMYTTCDLNRLPNYKVKSKRMTLYPKSGAVLARHDVLYFSHVPIFYFPSFFYRSNSYAALADDTVPGQVAAVDSTVDQVPVPEFGNNVLEGSFFKAKFGYLKSRRAYGYYLLGTTSEEGLLVGVKHNVLHSSYDRTVFRLNNYANSGFQGGATYIRDIAQRQQEGVSRNALDSLFDAVLPAERIPVSQFSLKLMRRQPIQQLWVDFTPKIQLATHALDLGNNWTFSGAASVASIHEEDVRSGSHNYSVKMALDTEIGKSYPLTQRLTFSSNLINRYYVYDEGQSWERLLLQNGIVWDVQPFAPWITYVKRIINEGESVFSYDSLNAIQTDAVGVGARIQSGDFALRSSAYFDVEGHQILSVIHELTYSLHCMDLIARFDTVLNSFGFSISVR